VTTLDGVVDTSGMDEPWQAVRVALRRARVAARVEDHAELVRCVGSLERATRKLVGSANGAGGVACEALGLID